MSRNIQFHPGDIWEYKTAADELLHYIILSYTDNYNNAVLVHEVETSITEIWPAHRKEYPPYHAAWNKVG